MIRSKHRRFIFDCPVRSVFVIILSKASFVTDSTPLPQSPSLAASGTIAMLCLRSSDINALALLGATEDTTEPKTGLSELRKPKFVPQNQ